MLARCRWRRTVSATAPRSVILTLKRGEAGLWGAGALARDLFSRNDIADILKALKVDQPIQLVMLGKLRSGALLVFPDGGKEECW